MMRKVVYPGSFDPCTLAHIDIVRRAAQLFDFVHVGVLVNNTKRPMFPADVRVEMLRAALAAEGIENCDVREFEGMLVDFARSVGACTTVRGVRNVSDFDAEMSMSELNSLLCPGLETVLLPAAPQTRSLSSSAVREIMRCSGSIDGFVHEKVIEIINERLV